MEVVYGFPPLTSKGNFIALGNFDGVHIGHKEIITTMVSEAKKLNGISCVVTFRNHPSQLLKPHMPAKLLTPPSVKAKLISSLGVDSLVLLDFNRDLAALSPVITVLAIKGAGTLICWRSWGRPLVIRYG